MRPNIIAEKGPEAVAGLTDIPTISLTMNDAEMFGPGGIHGHPMQGGREWEIPVSVEYMDSASAKEFQIDAGIRINGRGSRMLSKRMFRLFFRSEYGNPTLDFPFFDDSPVDQFNTLILPPIRIMLRFIGR